MEQLREPLSGCGAATGSPRDAKLSPVRSVAVAPFGPGYTWFVLIEKENPPRQAPNAGGQSDPSAAFEPRRILSFKWVKLCKLF